MADVSKNINKTYLVRLLYGAQFAIAIVILYYLSFGLSYFQVGLLESVFLITGLIFEIPTGIIADKIGRRNSTVIGAGLIPFACITTALAHDFITFAFVSFIWGVAIAFMNGASEALVYDSLKEINKEDDYVKVGGKAMASFFITTAIFAPLGAYLFTVERHIPFIVDTFITIIPFFVYLTMTEPQKWQTDEKPSYLAIFKEGFGQIFNNLYIRWYILFGLLLMGVLYAFSSTFSQPILIQQGLPVKQIGFVFSVYTICQAFTSFYASKIEERLGESKSIFLIILLLGLSLIAMRIPVLFIVLPFYILHFTTKGFMNPILMNYLQKHISSSVRATTLSIQNFGDGIVGAIVVPLFGFIADKSSVPNSVLILGLTMLVGGFLFFIFKPKINSQIV